MLIDHSFSYLIFENWVDSNEGFQSQLALLHCIYSRVTLNLCRADFWITILFCEYSKIHKVNSWLCVCVVWLCLMLVFAASCSPGLLKILFASALLSAVITVYHLIWLFFFFNKLCTLVCLVVQSILSVEMFPFRGVVTWYDCFKTPCGFLLYKRCGSLIWEVDGLYTCTPLYILLRSPAVFGYFSLDSFEEYRV